MAREFTHLKFTDVTFVEDLKEGKYSAVFKVVVRGTTCVMKMWHDWIIYEPEDIEENPFLREYFAYRRLKEKGLCERGVVPDFYGTITDIKLSLLPTEWPAETYSVRDMFQKDNSPLNAILIEYIPGLEKIDLSNYSTRYLDDIRRILGDIHLARVFHNDPYPRNFMISREQDRVLWMDFHCSETFPETSTLTKEQKAAFRQERGIINHFIKDLTKDYNKGKLKYAQGYYSNDTGECDESD
ncbi:unnamed protein product [Penicillium glandicola]